MIRIKKQTVENPDEMLLNFTKEDFLLLLRDKLAVDEELISDEDLLSQDMKSLSVDSLDYVETIMEVEMGIGRRIPAENVEEFECFQDVWDYVHTQQENLKKLQ